VDHIVLSDVSSGGRLAFLRGRDVFSGLVSDSIDTVRLGEYFRAIGLGTAHL
jgi:hypothetical protein